MLLWLLLYLISGFATASVSFVMDESLPWYGLLAIWLFWPAVVLAALCIFIGESVEVLSERYTR